MSLYTLDPQASPEVVLRPVFNRFQIFDECSHGNPETLFIPPREFVVIAFESLSLVESRHNPRPLVVLQRIQEVLRVHISRVPPSSEIAVRIGNAHLQIGADDSSTVL